MKGAKFGFIAAFEGDYAVADTCRAPGVSRQGYYAYRKSGGSAHELRDLELTREIARVYLESRRIYGAPKVHMALRRTGIRTSRRRVARIMRESGWRGVTRRCATRPGREKRAAKSESSPDLVGRGFKADGPNRAWLAGITCVRTHRGWLYPAAVMDVWSRKVVGWSMGPSINAEPAGGALKMAIARRSPPAGCIHHGGRGSQYVSLLLGATMREHGIRPSMGAVQSPRDDAVAESLMGIVKSGCVHARTFRSREEAALEIFERIECSCNRLRIHSALGWMSPCECEEAHAEESRPRAAWGLSAKTGQIQIQACTADGMVIAGDGIRKDTRTLRATWRAGLSTARKTVASRRPSS